MHIDLGFLEVIVRLKRDRVVRPPELRRYEVVSPELAPVVHRRLLRQIKRNLHQHSNAAT